MTNKIPLHTNNTKKIVPKRGRPIMVLCLNELMALDDYIYKRRFLNIQPKTKYVSSDGEEIKNINPFEVTDKETIEKIKTGHWE